MPEIRNLHELPRFRDGISYLYVERAVVEREAASIVVYKREGAFRVPAAALGVLLLGPGTRITHAAVRALAECGVTVLWVGEEGGRFYAAGLGETRSARRLYRQVRAWVRPRERLEVIKRLYRFRFDEELSEDLSLEELRGREGARVREAYARASRETGIPWRGRNYDRGCWEKADAVNRALSAGAAFLYGLCHAAIVSAGYSPALGFIHVGKQLSFVYDVADLYRTKVLVPAAFGLWLLYLWEVIVVGFGIPRVLLPAPSQLAVTLAGATDILAADFYQTFVKSVLSGYVLGCGSGFLVALLVDKVHRGGIIE